MIEACSVNVTDLAIYRRTQSGQGGDGADVLIAKNLRAHHEESAAAVRATGSRDTVVTDFLMIDGYDSDGDLVEVKAHDVAQWTNWAGQLTDKISIIRVSPHSEPSRGPGIGGLAHVRLDVG